MRNDDVIKRALSRANILVAALAIVAAIAFARLEILIGAAAVIASNLISKLAIRRLHGWGLALGYLVKLIMLIALALTLSELGLDLKVTFAVFIGFEMLSLGTLVAVILRSPLPFIDS